MRSESSEWKREEKAVRKKKKSIYRYVKSTAPAFRLHSPAVWLSFINFYRHRRAPPNETERRYFIIIRRMWDSGSDSEVKRQASASSRGDDKKGLQQWWSFCSFVANKHILLALSVFAFFRMLRLSVSGLFIDDTSARWKAMSRPNVLTQRNWKFTMIKGARNFLILFNETLSRRTC